MLISEVYEKYGIPEILRNHMYNVAAVASIVADSISSDVSIDKELIIKTCLIHDMGNILKIPLENNKLINADEVEELRKVKDLFITKYGNDEHAATQKILSEIGVSSEVAETYNHLGSSKIQKTIESSDWNVKICSYSDFRVSPSGVVGVSERFEDIIERYRGRDHALSNIERTMKKKDLALQIESQIQNKCGFDLGTLNNEDIQKVLESIRSCIIV